MNGVVAIAGLETNPGHWQILTTRREKPIAQVQHRQLDQPRKGNAQYQAPEKIAGRDDYKMGLVTKHLDKERLNRQLNRNMQEVN